MFIDAYAIECTPKRAEQQPAQKHIGQSQAGQGEVIKVALFSRSNQTASGLKLM